MDLEEMDYVAHLNFDDKSISGQSEEFIDYFYKMMTDDDD